MRSRLRLDTARGVFRKEQNTPHTYCPHLRRSDRTVIKPDQNVEHMSIAVKVHIDYSRINDKIRLTCVQRCESTPARVGFRDYFLCVVYDFIILCVSFMISECALLVTTYVVYIMLFCQIYIHSLVNIHSFVLSPPDPH